MAAATNKEIVERYYYKGWNKGDTAVVNELLHEKVKCRTAFKRKPTVGNNALVEYMKTIRSTLAKYSFEIDDMVVSDDRAAVRVTCRGLHKGTFFGVEGSGHEVHFSGTTFFTFKDGKISEIWTSADIDGLKNQIGAKPGSQPFDSPNISPTNQGNK